MFLLVIKGYKWILSWQLLLLTFFNYHYMHFQLDIWPCVCFDSRDCSESVKGQIVFQRVRSPFTHLLWALFLPAVEGACFSNTFPILACFSSVVFTLWVFGMRSYKDRKEEFILLLGMLLTIAISYPLICLKLLVGTGKMEMKKQTLWNKYICVARQSSQRRWLIIEFSIHCICMHNTKLPFSFHVPFDLSRWNVWDFACSARADHVFCDW